MWWGRALTIVRVVRLSRQVPRDSGHRWDDFWGGVGATGDSGDVLWDATDSEEAPRYLNLLGAHAAPMLPLVDIGCGNGRFTRTLGARFPEALGVDVSPAAVARAQAESASGGPGKPRVRFRALDVTESSAGNLLRSDLGEDANVFVRGLFHVLDVPARRRLAANVAVLVGARGVVLIAETNYRGPRIRYLESLGAGPRRVPSALARAIASGVPPPLSFGEAELVECFPSMQWNHIVIDTNATITTIPLRTPGVRDTIPGLVAVLSPRLSAASPGT